MAATVQIVRHAETSCSQRYLRIAQGHLTVAAAQGVERPLRSTCQLHTYLKVDFGMSNRTDGRLTSGTPNSTSSGPPPMPCDPDRIKGHSRLVDMHRHCGGSGLAIDPISDRHGNIPGGRGYSTREETTVNGRVRKRQPCESCSMMLWTLHMGYAIALSSMDIVGFFASISYAMLTSSCKKLLWHSPILHIAPSSPLGSKGPC